jgi:branched-chain amino acid transport system permease protein
LIIAVIGGIAHLEGAWIGAFVFVAANNYLRVIPLFDRIGITEARFNTVIGLLVLIIMLLSPDGIAGIVVRLRERFERLTNRARSGAAPSAISEAGDKSS